MHSIFFGNILFAVNHQDAKKGNIEFCTCQQHISYPPCLGQLGNTWYTHLLWSTNRWWQVYCIQQCTENNVQNNVIKLSVHHHMKWMETRMMDNLAVYLCNYQLCQLLLLVMPTEKESSLLCVSLSGQALATSWKEFNFIITGSEPLPQEGVSFSVSEQWPLPPPVPTNTQLPYAFGLPRAFLGMHNVAYICWLAAALEWPMFVWFLPGYAGRGCQCWQSSGKVAAMSKWWLRWAGEWQPELAITLTSSVASLFLTWIFLGDWYTASKHRWQAGTCQRIQVLSKHTLAYVNLFQSTSYCSPTPQ